MRQARRTTHAPSGRFGASGVALAAAVALLAAMLPVPARAQQPPPSLAITQVDTDAYPKMTAVVTVLDAEGIPVPALRAAQFKAADGNVALPISGAQSAQDTGLGLGVVLAIDTSGSMLGAPLDGAKQAAIAFVDSLGPNDKALVVSFADAVHPLATSPNSRPDFSGDHGALAAAIGSLQAEGATALYQAVQIALISARSSPAQRKAIVLLSDGKDEPPAGSTATRGGSLDAVGKGGVPVFTIGFGSDQDVPYLQALSNGSQGQYSAATATNVADVYAGIGRLLRGQYVLAFTNRVAADGSNGTLRVTATVDGAPVTGTATFAHGAAPVVAVPPGATAAAAPVPAPAASTGGGVSGTALAVIAAVLVALALVAGAVIAVRRARAAAAQRARESEAGRQSDEPLPAPRIAVAAPSTNGHAPTGSGRLVERVPGAEDRVFQLGAGPAVIGSSPRIATIVLPASHGVADEHARIWLRGGQYLLHHTAGQRRKTFVAGREADWVTLEPGDEVQIGSHRLIFEDGAADIPEIPPAPSPDGRPVTPR